MARTRFVFFDRCQSLLGGRRAVLLFLATVLLCLSGPPALAKFAALTDSPPPATTAQSAQDGLQRGKALYDAGRFTEAVAVLQQAVQDYQSQGDRVKQSIALSNLSLAHQQLGNWTAATETIAASLAILSPASDSPKLLAQTLDIQGRLYLLMGRPEQALTTWEQVTALYVRAGDQAGEIRSRINQAQALQASGFYRRALERLTELTPTLQSQTDLPLKMVGLRSLGDALQLVGDLEQSRQVLQQSLAIARRLNSPSDIGAALFSLGNTARIQQQTNAALDLYQQAAAIAPSELVRVQAQLNRLSLLADLEQWQAVTAQLPQVQTQLETLPPRRSTIYARVNLAQTLMQRVEPDGIKNVAQLLARAVQQARELGDRRAEAYALGSLAGLYEQTRQWSDARNLTQQALILSQDINAADIAYRWQWQLGRLLKQQGDVNGAIAAYDAAVRSLQSLRSDLVAVNREVQFNFRDSVEPVYRQSVELLLQAQNGVVSETNLDKARQRIESLQLAELDNFFREACLNAQSVLLDQVVDRDNPTAAVFYPIILPNKLAVILKIPQQPLRYHSIPISQPEAESVLIRLRQALIQPQATKTTRTLSQQVYRWLIQPVEADLTKSGVNTLVFVLDGTLRNVPIAALYDGQQYLVEKYAVALSPGLQLFAPQPLSGQQLNALTAGLTQPPANYENLAPLPEVKSELSLIEKAGVSTTTLLDQGFTSTALEQAINALPFRVVHLATHGQFSSQAKDTFILAADGPINVNQLDSLLRGREEIGSQAVELLVLSACQTAAGDNRATLGLAGVAVRAGARSTLASLWHIDDRSTAVFIGEFYRQLATAKLTKAEALRRAQIALLKDYPDYSRPIFWAPYVLVGNWL